MYVKIKHHYTDINDDEHDSVDYFPADYVTAGKTITSEEEFAALKEKYAGVGREVLHRLSEDYRGVLLAIRHDGQTIHVAASYAWLLGPTGQNIDRLAPA